MGGDHPHTWQELPLAECMAAIIDYRGKTPTKTSFGVPLVTAKVIKGGRIEGPNEFIAAEDYDVWMRRGLPQAGDVVMTTEAPLGEVAQLDGTKVALAQRVITLRGKPGFLDNTFLKFMMQSRFVQDQLRARASGTTVLGIKQSELRRITLRVPPFAEQRSIAQILGALDDKIELNRRTSETLEAMARALFKSWLVDFDPVRAKAEGRTLPGMDPATNALFPSEFEDSELGEIPKGWTASDLESVAELNPTRSLSKGALAPYVGMASLPTSGHRATDWDDREAGSGARFINGDTLLARITPCLENGKTGFVDFLPEGQVGWGSTEYIVIRPRLPLAPEWGYLLARDAVFRDFATQKMEGTTGRQRVPAAAIAKYPIVLPNTEVAEAFGDAVSPLFKKIKALDTESRTLAAARDALLPRLLSGELSVGEAQHIEGTT